MKNAKTIIFVICLIILPAVYAAAQVKEAVDKPKEPVLVPLTDEEKKLDPRKIVAGQPDFTAIENYFSASDISGFSASSKIARRGNQYRTDTGFVAVISELGKSDLRLNQDKTYEVTVGVRRPFVSATISLNPTDLLGFKDISLTALGTIEIDGIRLLKIQAKSAEFMQEVYLYADMSRKNLITIVQILGEKRRSLQRLVEISFDVPKELFETNGYRELPKFNWSKVKTAKVHLNGKPVEDALVFRHADYLFIHAGEFDHFFVDLKKKIADTVVFRGLLVAPDGSYIWATKEEEAISVGDLENYVKPDCDTCSKIQVEPNSVSVPDPEKKSKILLKITW